MRFFRSKREFRPLTPWEAQAIVNAMRDTFWLALGFCFAVSIVLWSRPSAAQAATVWKVDGITCGAPGAGPTPGTGGAGYLCPVLSTAEFATPAEACASAPVLGAVTYAAVSTGVPEPWTYFAANNTFNPPPGVGCLYSRSDNVPWVVAYVSPYASSNPPGGGGTDTATWQANVLALLAEQSNSLAASQSALSSLLTLVAVIGGGLLFALGFIGGQQR